MSQDKMPPSYNQAVPPSGFQQGPPNSHQTTNYYPPPNQACKFLVIFFVLMISFQDNKLALILIKLF